MNNTMQDAYDRFVRHDADELLLIAEAFMDARAEQLKRAAWNRNNMTYMRPYAQRQREKSALTYTALLELYERRFQRHMDSVNNGRYLLGVQDDN